MKYWWQKILTLSEHIRSLSSYPKCHKMNIFQSSIHISCGQSAELFLLNISNSSYSMSKLIRKNTFLFGSCSCMLLRTVNVRASRRCPFFQRKKFNDPWLRSNRTSKQTVMNGYAFPIPWSYQLHKRWNIFSREFHTKLNMILKQLLCINAILTILTM